MDARAGSRARRDSGAVVGRRFRLRGFPPRGAGTATAAGKLAKLETYLPAEPVRDVLLEQLRQMSAEQQQQLWQHVAAWGTDLLRGDVTLATAANT